MRNKGTNRSIYKVDVYVFCSYMRPSNLLKNVLLAMVLMRAKKPKRSIEKKKKKKRKKTLALDETPGERCVANKTLRDRSAFPCLLSGLSLLVIDSSVRNDLALSGAARRCQHERRENWWVKAWLG